MNRNAMPIPAPRRQRGLSLVEIMVAVTVSVILLAGVLQIFAGTKTSYRLQENTGRLQENGRFALDFLTRDIRMAGYRGCNPTAPISNTLNNPNSLAYDFTTGITGFDNITTAPAIMAALVPAPAANTDAIVIRRAVGNPVRVTRNNDAAQLFAEVTSTVNGACPDGSDKISDICNGDILMVSDCRFARIFQTNNIQVAGGELNIVHPAAGTPGNAISSWGGAAAPPEEKFDKNAEIIKVGTFGYYVGVRGDGMPALYRVEGNQAFELVEGVEDMQIVYGEDTNADRTADVYRSANQVAKWDNVVSARINLLLRSTDNNLTNTPQGYTFNGTTVAATSLPATDRYLRREFSATVTLRNRAQ